MRCEQFCMHARCMSSTFAAHPSPLHSDALSTAFKYPLIDAKLFDGENGKPVAETPLDGTQYELETGKVVVWCPANSLVRGMLGSLKKDVPQVPLKVSDLLFTVGVGGSTSPSGMPSTAQKCIDTTHSSRSSCPPEDHSCLLTPSHPGPRSTRSRSRPTACMPSSTRTLH